MNRLLCFGFFLLHLLPDSLLSHNLVALNLFGLELLPDEKNNEYAVDPANMCLEFGVKVI